MVSVGHLAAFSLCLVHTDHHYDHFHHISNNEIVLAADMIVADSVAVGIAAVAVADKAADYDFVAGSSSDLGTLLAHVLAHRN